MRSGRFGPGRCAVCGRPLNGGGLEKVGFGLVCWNCFHSGEKGGGDSLVRGSRSRRAAQSALDRF